MGERGRARVRLCKYGVLVSQEVLLEQAERYESSRHMTGLTADQIRR